MILKVASPLSTNRNFVQGGPIGRAAQMHIALGIRKGMIMDSPDKNQPKEHFFQIPSHYSNMNSGEHKNRRYRLQSFCTEKLNMEIVGREN